MIHFTRAQGLGNDYLVVVFDPPIDNLTPDVIRTLCDRHFGIGGDGVLIPARSEEADFGLRIFNPDGSEAEKSGNGLRIFARYLYDAGLLNHARSIETGSGLVRVRSHPPRDGAAEFSVEMGQAEFDTSRIPMSISSPQAIDAQLTAGPHTIIGTAVSIGNPHWVMFADPPATFPFDDVAPLIESHPMFPNRTNVQCAEVLEHNAVRVKIWERGVGPTLASGSSACAVVAAGVKTGRLGPTVCVHMAGGTLEVSCDTNFRLCQRGPASVIATGLVAPELEQLLRLPRAP